MIVKVPGVGDVRVKDEDVAAFEAAMKKQIKPEKGIDEIVKALESVITSSNERLVVALIGAVKSIKIPEAPSMPEFPAFPKVAAKPVCLKSDVTIIRDWRNMMTGFTLTHHYADGSTKEIEGN